MKRFLRDISTIFMTMLLIVGCVQVEPSTSSTVSSSEISSSSTVATIEMVDLTIERLPYKLEFTNLEGINTAGGQLKVSLSNGQSFVIDMKDDMVDYSLLNMASVGTQSVRLNYTYQGISRSVSYPITIRDFRVAVENIFFVNRNLIINIFVGNTRQLLVTFVPENATNQGIRYVSSAPDIVSIDQFGMMSALKVGEATVTATSLETNQSISKTVIVDELVDQLTVTYARQLVDRLNNLIAGLSPSNYTAANFQLIIDAFNNGINSIYQASTTTEAESILSTTLKQISDVPTIPIPVLNVNYAEIELNLGSLSIIVISSGVLNPQHPLLGGRVIFNSITIAPSVGDGEVTISGLIVVSSLIVNGGGANSIILNQMNISQVVINKDQASGEQTVRVEFNDGSFEEIIVYSGATIDLDIQTEIPSVVINSSDQITFAGGGKVGSLQLRQVMVAPTVILNTPIESVLVLGAVTLQGSAVPKIVEVNAPSGAVNIEIPTTFIKVVQGSAIIGSATVTEGQIAQANNDASNIVIKNQSDLDQLNILKIIEASAVVSATDSLLINMAPVAGLVISWNQNIITTPTNTNNNYILSGLSFNQSNTLKLSAPGYFDRTFIVANVDLSFRWDNPLYYDTTWYNSSLSEFVIFNAKQLSGLANLVNNGETFLGKTIRLGANMNLLNQEWTPIGVNWITANQASTNKPFQGTFDGQNFEISNLLVSQPQGVFNNYVGLFGAVNGTIRNLKINNATVVGTDYVGTVVGNINGSIENVLVRNANVTGNHFVGGVAGLIQGYGSSLSQFLTLKNARVENSTIIGLFNTTINDDGDKVGGIVGYMRYARIEDVQVLGLTISAYRDVGGVVGANATDSKHAIIRASVINSSISATKQGQSGHASPYVGTIIGRPDGSGANIIYLFDLEVTNTTATSYDDKPTYAGNPYSSLFTTPVESNVLNFSKLLSYNSIQSAIDSAVENDVIIVDGGTYFEEVKFINRQGLTLIGKSDGSTVIAPTRLYIVGNNGITIDNSRFITVKHITIDGYANPSLGSVPTFRDGVHYLADTPNHNNTFENLIVRNVDRRGISVFPMTTTNTTIRNSLFENVTGAVMGTWNGSIGINFQGTGLVQNNEVRNVHTGLIHNSDLATGTIIISNNYFHSFKDGALSLLNVGINVWTRKTETMIIENNIIVSNFSNQVGMYLNSLSSTSKINNNTITINAEHVIGLDILNNKSGGYEIKGNIITVGAYSTGIALSTVGSQAMPMQLIANQITNSDTIIGGAEKIGKTIGYEYNDFFFNKTISREVGILISGQILTKRVKDTPGFGLSFANLTGNEIANFFETTKVLDGFGVTNITFNKTSTTITVGSSDTITATVSPEEVTNKELLWISRNAAIATVVNGVVTGVAAGTVKIDVYSADYNFRKEINVTVTNP
jgi:uncharacterized protein YjdB